MKRLPQRSATKLTTARRRRARSGASAPASIAIDGPVAAGKSAVGARVAQQLGYSFIDTGVMYRALTWLALERQVDLEDAEALGRLAEDATVVLEPGPPDAPDAAHIVVDGIDVTGRLRSTEVGAAVSLVSRVPAVRKALVALQRGLARRGRVVMAGRDIGTVVLPNAPLKVYLNAYPEERARRRHEELRAMGRRVSLQEVRDELALRDAIDSSRDTSPLRPAKDAVVIDTDRLSLDEVVQRILDAVPCRS